MKIEFSQNELDSIRDALEMRARECKEHVKSLSNMPDEVSKRLVLTFQHTADKATALLNRMEKVENELFDRMGKPGK